MPATFRRLLWLVLAVAFAASGLATGGSHPAFGQAGLASERAAAQRLRTVVEAERRRIEATGAGLGTRNAGSASSSPTLTAAGANWRARKTGSCVPGCG